MNIDDLIQYVSQEGVLIGMQLKSRSFLIVQLRCIEHSDNIQKICTDIDLISLSMKKVINLYHGLYWTCGVGHKHLAEWMISKGANWCYHCDKSAREHLEPKI